MRRRCAACDGMIHLEAKVTLATPAEKATCDGKPTLIRGVVRPFHPACFIDLGPYDWESVQANVRAADAVEG